MIKQQHSIKCSTESAAHESSTDSAAQAEHQHLLAGSGFQLYETLSPFERTELVHSATQYVSAWLAKPLVLPQGQQSLRSADRREASSPLPMSQQLLLERQQSGASASSSQSQHTQNAVSTSPAPEPSSKLHSSNGGHLHASSTSAPNTPLQHSSSSTEGPMSASAYEPVGHTQEPSPAASTTAIGSLENEHTASSVSAAEAAQQHQPLDDIKVLGEEAAVPSSTPPQTLASPAAQATASPSTSYQVQELDNAIVSDLSLQHLSLQTESRALPEAWEVHSSNGLSQAEDGLTDSTAAGVQLSSSGDDVLPSSIEGEPEGKAQRAVKAETLAFQASFAQAAAAGKADGTAGVEFATAGQRSEAWHTMRQSRLTASAFANALGYGLDDSLMIFLQTMVS